MRRMSSCNCRTLMVPRCLQNGARKAGRASCRIDRTLDTRFCMSSHDYNVAVWIGNLHRSSHFKKCINDNRTSFTSSTCINFAFRRSTRPKTFPQTHRTEAENNLHFRCPQLHRFFPHWLCLLANCCRSERCMSTYFECTSKTLLSLQACIFTYPCRLPSPSTTADS